MHDLLDNAGLTVLLQNLIAVVQRRHKLLHLLQLQRLCAHCAALEEDEEEEQEEQRASKHTVQRAKDRQTDSLPWRA